MTTRLVVYLARAGVASRREAGDMVKSGRVRVNGDVNTNPASQIDEMKDHVRVDGKMIKKIPPRVYLMLNKPKGTVTTRNDPLERPTVFDYLGRVSIRVEPVGRLDFDTEGLLLFTNDGGMAQRLAKPSGKVEKIYDALVKGRVGKEALAPFFSGIVVDGRKTLPARAKILGRQQDDTMIRITVVEGRYHQIKLMCQAVGHPVKKLRRIAFGPLFLGELSVGEFRYLTDDEVGKLLKGQTRCEEIL